jgi:hypothetical protein
MRKRVMVSVVLAAFLLLGSAVYANFPDGYRNCLSRYNMADLEKVKQFQHDTLQLRDELMVKKLAIRQEYAKAAPDRQKIAALQKEVIDIRTQIHQKADENGIPLKGCGKIGKRMVGKKMMMRGHQCSAGL